MTSPLNPELYSSYVPSSRTGAFFRVHPYPTKINPEAIVPFLLAHTEPGDRVYDPFAGTCSLGAAVLNLCTPAAQDFDNAGPREAICNDLGFLPTWIANTIFGNGDSDRFRESATDLLADIREQLGWLYHTENPHGTIRYTFWTDYLICDTCGTEAPYFDTFVDTSRGGFIDDGKCPECSEELNRHASRVTETHEDPVLETTRRTVKRRPVRLYGRTPDKGTWNRDIINSDRDVLDRARNVLRDNSELVPVVELGKRDWGEMYRAGYHTGITHVHHFYTHRNLLALGSLYDRATTLSAPYDDLFRLAVSAYNAAHSSLMTRFVFKSGKPEPVVTSAQPGTLYIPHCPVEKNVFLGVERKIRAISRYMAELPSNCDLVTVQQGPAQTSRLPDASVDYIFTDPPFGGNIQYAELARISEAWLGAFTDPEPEAIVSEHHDKDVETYEAMLADVFAECYRVLKPGKFLTVVFHSAHKEIWQALQKAIAKAGFVTLDATILNKEQKSFKQVTTSGAVWKDPVLLAVKPVPSRDEEPVDEQGGGQARRQENASKGTDGATQYSRYVVERLKAGELVDLDAHEFREKDEQ